MSGNWEVGRKQRRDLRECRPQICDTGTNASLLAAGSLAFCARCAYSSVLESPLSPSQAMVVLFAYVFVHKWQLGMVALLQMTVYAGACILIGRICFGERVTAAQALGMLLAFCGAVLMAK